MPIIDLALNAVEQGFGMPTVETSIGPGGATTNLICFDDGGDHEALLLKCTGRQLGLEEDAVRLRPLLSALSFVRAHRWQRMSDEGRFASVRELGAAAGVAHS